MINANKGMYIEQLVERTIKYFKMNNICHLEKRQIPITILKKINSNIFIGRINSKSYVDYFGFINNKFVELEVKQTQKNYFDFDLIKQHQITYLSNCHKFNIKPYLIIHFEINDSIWIVEFEKIMNWVKNNKKRIDYQIFSCMGQKVEITYPGIIRLDLLIK